MSKNSSRISRIEKQIRPASKGHQAFFTLDQETFYKDPSHLPGRIDYRAGIVEGQPAPGEALSKADLEALEQDGWDLFLVSYVDSTSKPGSQFDSITA